MIFSTPVPTIMVRLAVAVCGVGVEESVTLYVMVNIPSNTPAVDPVICPVEGFS